MSAAIDVVDTQLHMGRGAIASTLAAMDALGIRSVLIDEFWGTWDSPEPTHIQPGHRLANGAWRATWPTATEAGLLHSDRFGTIARIDRHDPELEIVMRAFGSSPHARAFRLQPVWTLQEAQALEAGAYEPLLEIAADIGLPICWFVPGYAASLVPYMIRFQKLTFVLDHCGMGFPNIPPGRPPAAEQRVLDPSHFDTVLALAEHPNLILKWSHAQDRFGAHDYPYEPLRAPLRKAISAFGRDRIMWASDHTVMFGQTWGDLLYSLRDDPDLSLEEKTAILGRTARRIFDWPVRPPPPQLPPHS